MQEQYISLSDLRKVSGIGDKTIERIKTQLLQSELDDNYKSEYNANIKLDINNIYQGDCLELMNGIPDKSVDMILADLPYGTTACKWDTIIPFEPLWEQYNRIIKDNGAIVLFGSQPFTSALVMSNPKLFRYQWVWKKSKCGNFQLAKYQPLKYTEDVLVFSKKKHNYYPILRDAPESTKQRRKYSYEGSKDLGGIKHMASGEYKQKFINGKDKINPTNLIEFKNERRNVHPTLKPVDLCEYLIKTYTNEGELVLDNCAGSFTTAVACDNTNRNWICIEKEEKYCNIGLTRINDNRERLSLPLLNSITTQL